LAACQILFVSRSAAKHYDKALDAVKNSITLTIGEDGDFLHAGGMLNLQPAEAGVLFDVNLDALKRRSLEAQFATVIACEACFASHGIGQKLTC
jgi:hypothetical protein